MADYIINGGKKLSGEVTIGASKNSALAILAAALLNDGKTTIKNLPKMEEIFRIIEIMSSIGIRSEWKGKAFEIDMLKSKINLDTINVESAVKTRAIILFIGSLVHKFKNFSLPASGGCKLGRRTIMPHLYALENFGIDIKAGNDKFRVSREELKPAKEIIMYESGDTATENAVMAAALIPGKTVIKFASANYQIQDLCCFLSKLGVKFDGVGSTTLTIFGRKKIKKNISYDLIEDPIEAMFFIAAAATTNSSIIVKRCPIEFLELELFKLKKMGFKYKLLKEYRAKNGLNKLADIQTFVSKLTAPDEKIYGRPFPGLNIDNLPYFVPIATQSEGETLIHDWVYENRAMYFVELNRLGADVRLADPHRAFIKGPTKLTGAEVMCPPALRPSTIILAAMLAAEGKSVLKNIYAIERGHENLVEKLQGLGAEIEKIEG